MLRLVSSEVTKDSLFHIEFTNPLITPFSVCFPAQIGLELNLRWRRWSRLKDRSCHGRQFSVLQCAFHSASTHISTKQTQGADLTIRGNWSVVHGRGHTAIWTEGARDRTVIDVIAVRCSICCINVFPFLPKMSYTDIFLSTYFPLHLKKWRYPRPIGWVKVYIIDASQTFSEHAQLNFPL